MKIDKFDIIKLSKPSICQVKSWFEPVRHSRDYVSLMLDLTCKSNIFFWIMQKKQVQISSFRQNDTSINFIRLNVGLPYPEYRVLVNRRIKGRSFREIEMRRLYSQLTFNAIMQLTIY